MIQVHLISYLVKRFTLTALIFSFFLSQSHAQQSIQQYLSGTDKDHTVQWDFFCTKGMNSGKWSTIQVPSNWEQQSFGASTYGRDKVRSDEQGMYKYHFKVAKELRSKKVFIVFEGSMTDTEVKINSKSAGQIHQGGFYRFKYEITDLINFGDDNLLEVTVSKMSSEISINKAEREGDFWTLGGIYRPCLFRGSSPNIY